MVASISTSSRGGWSQATLMLRTQNPMEPFLWMKLMTSPERLRLGGKKGEREGGREEGGREGGRVEGGKGEGGREGRREGEKGWREGREKMSEGRKGDEEREKRERG